MGDPEVKTDPLTQPQFPGVVEAGSILGQGNVSGGKVYNTININSSGGHESRELSLQKMDALPHIEPFSDSAAVAKFARLLQARHLLVIEHESGGSGEAESAMYSTLTWLQREGGLSNRWTNKRHDPPSEFNIFFFRDYDTWMEECKGSVIYLNKYLSDMVSEYVYDHPTVETLRGRLTQCDCRLIVVIRRPLQDQRQQALADIDVWKVGPPDAKSPGALLPDTTDTTELVLRACVALLPGLSPLELVNIIDRLLPERSLTPSAPQAAVPAGAKQNTDSPPPADQLAKRNALQRWHDGDRDSLLAELGLQHRAPPEGVLGDDESGAHGYFFETAEVSAVRVEWLYTKFPLLLVKLLPTLTDVYFSVPASSRYQKGYLRYLISLHKRNLQRLESQWLISRFHTVTGSDDPSLGVDRFQSLITYVVRNLPDGGDLAASVLRELGSHAEVVEDIWHDMLLESGIRATPNESVEPFALSDAYTETVKKILLVQGLLIFSCSEILGVASEAIAAALVGSDRRRRLHSSSTDTRPPFILPSVELFYISMSNIATDDPEVVIAFSAKVVEQLRENHAKDVVSVSDRIDSLLGDKEQRFAAAQLMLIESCQEGFNSMLPGGVKGMPDAPLSDKAYVALFSNGQGRRAGEIFGKLCIYWAARVSNPTDKASKLPRVVVEELIHFYGALCVALLLRKDATPAAVTTELASFVAPMCATLHTAQRMELLQHTRELYKTWDEWRAMQQRLGSRKDAEQTGRWVRALRVVAYTLSQNSPKATVS